MGFMILIIFKVWNLDNFIKYMNNKCFGSQQQT